MELGSHSELDCALFQVSTAGCPDSSFLSDLSSVGGALSVLVTCYSVSGSLAERQCVCIHCRPVSIKNKHS